ncbi:phage/plasmid primase-like uncharacterized protein [Xenorhabdus ehlersii]|uniref:DNA primase n=1 Tax=Xenorhabdus ehlersii TaxID=290111 RepID=A0A2D0IJL7_9GAMM|nr:DNA primase [Xenorhabdus ehlersii]RKE92954.1 phage/plasmid primase-like uncharacterized protein [Xenorhabdus ehlersii]
MVYRLGRVPIYDIIVIARELITHGVIGRVKIRKLQRHEGTDTYSDQFNAIEYINAARTHFGMSREEAERLTMTEFQMMLKAKFPDEKGFTREEYDAVIEADDKRNNNQKSRPLDIIRTVKKSAINHWQSLLPACGVDVPAKGKHGACPICGGTDRFHFIDDNHHGDWHCRQCDEPNHGDGLDLVARTKGITVFAAAKLVADVLAMPLPEPKIAKEQSRAAKPIAERIMALVATAVKGESQYLLKKGLQCPNQRLLKDGSLLLVTQTLDGTITGAQTIKPNGEKRLVAGTQKKGSFIPISKITGTPDIFIITEGYATALTVRQLHKGVVLAAIDESNLLTVAEQVRTQWPDAKIILAADNDWHEPEERDKNGRLTVKSNSDPLYRFCG